MTIKSTSRFGFQYIDDNEPYKNLPGVTEQVAKRLESAMSDANIPPGNPDLNDILERIATIGPPQIQTLRVNRFKVEAGRAWDIGPLTNDTAQSSTTQLATPDGNGHIRVTKTGWHTIWCSSSALAAPGAHYYLTIRAPGQLAVEAWTNGTVWSVNASTSIIWLEAGARVKFECRIATTADVVSVVKIQYHGNRKNSP